MSEQSTELVVINAQSAIQIFTDGGMGAVLDAQAKRQADEALKLRIRAEILEDLNAAATPVDAIMDGRVRHVRVVF